MLPIGYKEVSLRGSIGDRDLRPIRPKSNYSICLYFKLLVSANIKN